MKTNTDPTAASSLHPNGEPCSPNVSLEDHIKPKTAPFSYPAKSFSKGLPKYFHVRPHRGETDLKNGFILEYSLKRYDISEGDKIAQKWAAQLGCECTGSGCAMCGDPIRDMSFVPLRTLPTVFLKSDADCLLPRLYRAEIEGSFVTVTFETRRIPILPNSSNPYEEGFKSVRQFLDGWASRRNMTFCSSCLNTPDDPSDFSDTSRSWCAYSPSGIGGSIKLLVTPGRPFHSDATAPSDMEDEPLVATPTEDPS